MTQAVAEVVTEAIAVVGPTASGKTALAIALGERLGTEVISADSMQFYRGMEIGTAAPTPEERARVTHHFVGFLNPGEPMSAGHFQSLARPVVANLNAQGKPAVVAGGAGLYIRALLDGLFSGPGRDDEIRERLQREADSLGVEALYERLQAADPAYANLIGPRDLKRIVRALEVHELTGQPLSALHDASRDPKPLEALQVAIDWPRAELYARIDRRVEHMLTHGLLEEVRRLVENGYGTVLEQLKSLGYREIAAHLRGETSLEHATERMKLLTRRYAKRQLSWFRADHRVVWLPPAMGQGAMADSVLGLVAVR